MPAARTILFAGGGTGGHISPGLAIAERLAEIDPALNTLFVCSQRPVDALMLDDAGAASVAIPAVPPSVRPAAALRFLRAYRASRRAVAEIIRDRHVEHVVALGGFVAAPAVSAAAGVRVPVTLLNLDAPPGKANRLMARRCSRVLTAVPLPTMPAFAQRVVGMPIRRRALAPCDAAGCRARLGIHPDRPTLLVTGASQGATSINRFMTAFAAAESGLLADWQLIHLAGGADEADVTAAYQSAGIAALVMPFLHEMGLAWGAADLAVSRAGASSVAEAHANAVPTLFLPYPWHRDEHQRHNAAPLVAMGGASIESDRIDVDANLGNVGPALRVLIADETARRDMRRILLEHPPPDAAMLVARLLAGESA